MYNLAFCVGLLWVATLSLPAFARAPVHCFVLTPEEAREVTRDLVRPPPARAAETQPTYEAALRAYLGRERPPDYGEAARLFRMAAMAGNAEARYRLADMYVKGQGLPQDYEIGLRELLGAIPGLEGALHREAVCYAGALARMIKARPAALVHIAAAGPTPGGTSDRPAAWELRNSR